MNAMDEDTRRIHLGIRGHVQGVFFRASTQRRARELGLAGWVRNRPDGSVEAVAEGPPEGLERLVEFCRQGPPAARVDEVDVRHEDPTGELDGFRVRY